MTRRALCLLLLCALALPLPLLRADQPPSSYFPKDTFLYVEADVAALLSGIPKLDIMRMVDDEQVQDFLAPMMEEAGIEPGEVVASLMSQLPLEDWVGGRVAVGLRGVKLTFVRADGEKKVYELGPGKPVSAALLHEMLGFSVPMWIGRRPPRDSSRNLIIEPDLLIVVDPGPELRRVAPRYIEKAASWVQSRETVEIAGRQVIRLSATEQVNPGVTVSFSAYGDLSGDRWFLSSSQRLLHDALTGGSPDSLSKSKSFQDVRARLTGGTSVAFAYLDIAGALEIARSLAPPILMEEMEFLGLSSVRGMGMGISFAAGGVRESMALVFDGQPRGIFELLEAAPRGIPALDVAPLSTAGLMAMKFDAPLLLKKLRKITNKLLPGNEAYLDMLLAQAKRETGIDIVDDLLPALGDEIAVVVKPVAPIPQILATLRIRDEAKVHKLLEMGKGLVTDMGMQIRSLKVRDGLEENGFRFRISLFGSMGQNISVVVRHGRLIMSNSSIVLRNFVKGLQSEDTENLAANSEVFKKVLDGLSGGERESLVALAYTDLRSLVEVGLPLLNMIPRRELEDFVNMSAVPEMETLNEYISGMAFALRRDAQAVSIDMYSPLGLMTVGAGAGAFAAIEHEQRMREFDRAMEAEREQARRAELEAMQAANAEGPFVGFRHADTNSSELAILEVIPATPADKAGILAGDVIVSFDGKAVANIDDFRRAVRGKKPGDTVILIVRRGEDQQVAIPLVLGRRGDFNQ